MRCSYWYFTDVFLMISYFEFDRHHKFWPYDLELKLDLHVFSEIDNL